MYPLLTTTAAAGYLVSDGPCCHTDLGPLDASYSLIMGSTWNSLSHLPQMNSISVASHLPANIAAVTTSVDCQLLRRASENSRGRILN